MKYDNMTEEQVNEYRRVAYYYYKVGMTQDEIAKRLKMSRQRVNRIVSACVKMGIVRINIEGLEQCNLEMETRLEQKYGLKEVRIIDSGMEEDLFRDLGIEAGLCLKGFINEGDIIGVGRGRATAALVDNIEPWSSSFENITITQLTGSTKESRSQEAVDKIVYRLAEKLHAKEAFLYAPVIVSSAELKKSFMEEPSFKETYEIIKKCKIAVVGIGTAHSQWKHMGTLYDETDREQTRWAQTRWAQNVVGEVCTHVFDQEGREIESPFRDRIISIEAEDYKNIPLRIGIAGGNDKADAIRAALTGGYINVLITDSQTAQLL